MLPLSLRILRCSSLCFFCKVLVNYKQKFYSLCIYSSVHVCSTHSVMADNTVFLFNDVNRVEASSAVGRLHGTSSHTFNDYRCKVTWMRMATKAVWPSERCGMNERKLLLGITPNDDSSQNWVAVNTAGSAKPSRHFRSNYVDVIHRLSWSIRQQLAGCF